MEKFGRGEFHTVKYYGSTYWPDLGYGLVMEYVGGGDLRSWLLRYNPSKPHLVSIVFVIPPNRSQYTEKCRFTEI